MEKLIKLGLLLALAGCMNQAQFLASHQTMAMNAAVNRAQFELNCPQATGTILSQEVVQPAIQGPVAEGLQRAEYTIGVSGCGERKTYVILCPEGGDGCFAAGPGRFLKE